MNISEIVFLFMFQSNATDLHFFFANKDLIVRRSLFVGGTLYIYIFKNVCSLIDYLGEG